MKRIVILGVSVIGLLTGCGKGTNDASAEGLKESQGLIQVQTAVESEDLNKTLNELHSANMKIISVDSWTSESQVNDRRVYDITYEQPVK